MVQRFFDYVQQENYDAAQNLLFSRFQNNRSEFNRHHLEKINWALKRYDLPPKSKWKVTYTTSEILKLKVYSIEIYSEPVGNSTTGLVVDLTFDNSREHAGDSIMFINTHTPWKD